MPTTSEMGKKGRGLGSGKRFKKRRKKFRYHDKWHVKKVLGLKKKADPLEGSPQAKGIVLEKRQLEAKQPNCFDTQTELLTTSGWKKYDKIKDNEKIFTYDIEKDTVTKETIKRKITEHYNGPMVFFKGQNLDFMVTPNHRMLYRMFNRNKTLSNYGTWSLKIREASKMPRKCIMIPRCAVFEGEKETDENLLKIIAWIITEGWVHGTGYCIGQSRKSKYWKEIKKVLKAFCSGNGYSFKEHKTKSYDYFYINANASRKIRKHLPKYKEIPDWVFDLTHKQRLIFIKTLMKGDGCFSKAQKYFKQRNNDTLDKFLTLCAISGISAQLSDSKHKNKIKGKIYPACQRVNIRTRSGRWVGSKKGIDWKLVPYKGKVWCVETESGFIITRRGGKPLISHNSAMRKAVRVQLTKNGKQITAFVPGNRAITFINEHDQVTVAGIGGAMGKTKGDVPQVKWEVVAVNNQPLNQLVKGKIEKIIGR